LMEEFLRDAAAFPHWQQLGALQTLASYGIHPRRDEAPADLRNRFLAVFPRLHELFLRRLQYGFSCGDFLFVHAGIRPGIPIERQDLNDLLWIRHEFLDSSQDHGKFIVHGHTPVSHPDIRSNRMDIDTGAWKSGTLTCAAIEGTTILIL
jgi:serine/threonine protein phosphatase 1